MKAQKVLKTTSHAGAELIGMEEWDVIHFEPDLP
jgi:hypothetical protein